MQLLVITLIFFSSPLISCCYWMILLLIFIFWGGKAAPSSGDFQEVDGESEERRRARLERHQRAQERAVCDLFLFIIYTLFARVKNEVKVHIALRLVCL